MAQGNKKAKSTPYQKQKAKGKAFTKRASKHYLQRLVVTLHWRAVPITIHFRFLRCPDPGQEGETCRESKAETNRDEECEPIGRVRNPCTSQNNKCEFEQCTESRRQNAYQNRAIGIYFIEIRTWNRSKLYGVMKCWQNKLTNSANKNRLFSSCSPVAVARMRPKIQPHQCQCQPMTDTNLQFLKLKHYTVTTSMSFHWKQKKNSSSRWTK